MSNVGTRTIGATGTYYYQSPADYHRELSRVQGHITTLKAGREVWLGKLYVACHATTSRGDEVRIIEPLVDGEESEAELTLRLKRTIVPQWAWGYWGINTEIAAVQHD